MGEHGLHAASGCGVLTESEDEEPRAGKHAAPMSGKHGVPTVSSYNLRCDRMEYGEGALVPMVGENGVPPWPPARCDGCARSLTS